MMLSEGLVKVVADCAKPRRDVVHGEAVLPETMRGGAVALHVECGNARSIAETREDEQSPGGDFAAVFCRGVDSSM